MDIAKLGMILPNADLEYEYKPWLRCDRPSLLGSTIISFVLSVA